MTEPHLPTQPSPASPPTESVASPTNKHEGYFRNLRVPTQQDVHTIDAAQREREAEVVRKYQDGAVEAAKLIQRNYRGHRVRRELQGLSLTPSTRWVEAIRDARYRNEIEPRPQGTVSPAQSPGLPSARSRWRHFSRIARHAHGTGHDPDMEPMTSAEITMPNDETRPLSAEGGSINSTTWRGKLMGLPYFLEMVDQKHRYGSNLRAYHAEWLKADTHENFFYWLDHGAGREVETEKASRLRLEKEQVRYLSREERLQYLVAVDHEGKLCWNKNGDRIDTSPEYRDSVIGIVRQDDPSKTFRQDEIQALEAAAAGNHHDAPHSDDASSGLSSSAGSHSVSDGERRYPDPDDFNEAKGVKKVAHFSPETVMNRLLRKSVKKKTWIFVADTSMNLHVGIKQSGSFQHSSFMRGSRISSAGQIKIKRGQLRSLSPLSGHYQPPLAAFRHFVRHLETSGVDMSRVSISKSYAVLLGLEAYIGGKTRVQKFERGLKDGLDRVLHPAEAKARREAAKDSSQSARLEEAHRRRQQQERAAISWRGRVADGWTSRVDSTRAGAGPYGPDSRPTTRGSHKTASVQPGSAGNNRSRSSMEKDENSRPTTSQSRAKSPVRSEMAEAKVDRQAGRPLDDGHKGS